METPARSRVLINVEPYLLASAFARLLAVHHIEADVLTGSIERPDYHVCVSVIDHAVTHEAVTETTIWLPHGLRSNTVTVADVGRRFDVSIARPSDIVALVVRYAAEPKCCSAAPMPTG